MRSDQSEVLTEDALKPGDILFTMNHGEAAHVSIFLGKDGGKLTLAHAVNQGNYKHLMKTSVPPDDYVVFRCQDEKLAQLAAHIADNWASYKTPYDEQRLEIGTQVYNARTTRLQQEDHKKAVGPLYRKDFDETGKYRLVKYAARRGASISLPQGEGKGRGVWCGMFALMCFQTAAVAKAGLVKPIVGDGEHRWVSDKYHDPAEAKAYFQADAPKKSHLFRYAKFKKSTEAAMENYNHYVEKTRSKDEFVGKELKSFHKDVVKDHEAYSPSLVAWDFAKHGDIKNFDFEPYLTKGLMIEQKTADPAVFMHALSQDPEKWQNVYKKNDSKDDIGMVHIERKAATEEEKSEYRTQLNAHLSLADKHMYDMTAYLNRDLKQVKSPTYDKAIEGEQIIINRPGK